jgi:hypothetical protein
MTDALEETAQRIAERGREALLARLRPAFEQAAASHADVLDLDATELERMVQRAADRADGLQWRRALAAVATEELGIGLGEALGHPAVARAQAIVGAPSYEQSLAAITRGAEVAREPGDEAVGGAEAAAPPEPVAEPVGGAEAAAPPEPVAEPVGGAGAAAPPEPVAEPEAEPAVPREPEAEAAEQEWEAAAAEAYSEGLPILVAVTHLNGLSEVNRESALELCFTEDGLDVLEPGGRAAVTRFPWSEIRGLEVEPGRSRVLRRRGAGARLTLSATDRRARFEARGHDCEELKQRLEPALAKLGTER